MRRKNRLALALVLSSLSWWVTPGAAGILDATWTAPTDNADGSPLTDLASYLIYYGTSTSPCPGSSAVQVTSPTSSPGANQTMSLTLTGLSTGTLYYVAIAAVDSLGNQSGCSSVASAVARADFAVSPTGTVTFGSVAIGSSADQVFTVSNTAGGTVSGTASTFAPFTIVSGSPFTVSGVGASQTVTVRFTPKTTAAVSSTVSFTANGASSSVIVTGTGTTSGGPTGPVISQLSVSVQSSDATVGWTTNKPSDTQVEYGLTTSYGSVSALNSSLVTSHSQVISGLAPHTWYHARVRSRDAAGNLTVSGDVKFKTH